MRRNLKLYTIKEFFPRFFWQRCDICEGEFKKEYAWKICFPTITRIICRQCALTFKDAEGLALNWGDKGDLRPKFRHTNIIPPPKRKPRDEK